MHSRAFCLMPMAVLMAAAMICACSSDSQDEKMPGVNDENCAPEGIARIKDKGTRDQFQDMCVRRNTFKPSPKREW